MAFIDKGARPSGSIYVVTDEELSQRAYPVLQTQLSANPILPLRCDLCGDKAEFAAFAANSIRASFPMPAGHRRRRSVVTVSFHSGKVRGEAGRNVCDSRSETWPSNTQLAKLVPMRDDLGKTPPLTTSCVVRRWAKTAYAGTCRAGFATLARTRWPANGAARCRTRKAASMSATKHDRCNDVDPLVGRSRQPRFQVWTPSAKASPRTLTILTNCSRKARRRPHFLTLGFQLRRLALTARIHKQGAALEDAMDRAAIAKLPQAATARSSKCAASLKRR